MAASIPLARIHVLYLARRRETIHDLEASASSLSEEPGFRAASLGVVDRFEAIHLRAGDPVTEVTDVARQVDANLVIVSSRVRRLMRRRRFDALSIELDRPLVVAMPPHVTVPEIEPLCANCVAMREHSHGSQMWCTTHARPHFRAHHYSSMSSHPLSAHDSNVIPTGVDFRS